MLPSSGNALDVATEKALGPIAHAKPLDRVGHGGAVHAKQEVKFRSGQRSRHASAHRPPGAGRVGPETIPTSKPWRPAIFVLNPSRFGAFENCSGRRAGAADGPGGQAWIYDFRTALTATQQSTIGLDADVALESPLIGTTRLNPIARLVLRYRELPS
jgi:hypothetical protein